MSIKRAAAEKLLATKGELIEASVSDIPQGVMALIKNEDKIVLGLVSEKDNPILKLCKELTLEEEGSLVYGAMPTNANNAALVRRYVKGAGASSCGVKGISVGFCDWLGIVTPVVPELFKGRQLKPVLVEYTADNTAVVHRNFLEAMDTATWSVMESGLKSGYGAKATGLTNEEDIVKALLYGYTVIGIDCHAKINSDIEAMDDEAVAKRFEEFPMEFRAALRASYLNAEFKVGNSSVKFTEPELQRIVLEFGEAIMFVQSMYSTYLKDTPWDVDFEINISKKDKLLTPQEHYLIANELQRNGVKLSTISVNAAVERTQLDEGLRLHAAIADTFNYRLSLGNVGLAFKDLGALAKLCSGRVHLKMDNMLWLAALKTIAAKEPELMKRIAEAAGLEVAELDKLNSDALEWVHYAKAYDRILTSGEGALAAEIKQAVLAHIRVYEANAKEMIGGLLRTL